MASAAAIITTTYIHAIATRYIVLPARFETLCLYSRRWAVVRFAIALLYRQPSKARAGLKTERALT